MKALYRKTIAFFFYLFFMNVVLNPYVGGWTLYIYVLLPAFDYYFWRNLIRYRSFILKASVFFLSCVLALLLNNTELGIKALIIFWCCLYIFFLGKQRFRFLYVFIFFNIFFGLMQLGAYFTDDILFHALSPAHISGQIWGVYETPTGPATNDYFFFNRSVAGLSRETGFFASLIIITGLIYAKSAYKFSGYVILGIGYLVSFSKVSMVLPLIFLLKRLKELLNKIPSVPVLILSMIVITVAINLIYAQKYDEYHPGGSIIQRTAGYKFISDSGFSELLTGIKTDSIFEKYGDRPYVYALRNLKRPSEIFHGFGGFLVHGGIIAFIYFLVFIYHLKSTTSNVLILLLLTSTIFITAITSFIILSWYYFIFMNRPRRNAGSNSRG